MKVKHLVFAVMMLFLSTGCYGEMTGTVVDTETGKPIEGAVILAQWTKTKGFGLTHHVVHKIVEVETDNNGKFTISGTYDPFVDSPEVVIYKAGYVAWRNDFIFPDWERRTDFKYRRGITIRLERFKESYSKEQHDYFIGSGIIGASFERTPKFSAISIMTSKEAQQEIEEKKGKEE